MLTRALSDAPPETTTTKHHVRLEQFEGPLDLLLFLIKRAEINIYDIPIHEITEQYLQAIEYATKIDLENITEFYSLAATLLLIKSRMLLPTHYDDDEEFEDPRQELVDRLIEYQKFKRLTQLMSEQEKNAEWIIEPRRKQRSFDFVDDDELWQQIDVWDLLRTFTSMMTNLTPERIIDLYEEVSINEKLSLINELLEDRGEFTFADIVARPDSVMDVVCAFLAVLEAVKTRRIGIYQNRLFGDIRIRRRADVQNGGSE
ncbi:MAG: segregation and condensation protein A [Spirochaetota bacterium]